MSPRIVEVGQKVTFTLTTTADYGGVAPGFSLSTAPFTPASGFVLTSSPRLSSPKCRGGKIVEKRSGPFDVSKGLAGSYSCTYKVLSSGRGWQVATASFSVRYGGLASYSQESWAAVPKESVIEGYVRGKPRHPHEKGIPLSNVSVKAAGHGGSSSKTNSEGFYAIELAKPGTYDVIPKLRRGDEALRPRPHFTPGSHRQHVDSQHVKDVNFSLNRGDSLRLRFVDGAGHEISSIPADGESSATAVIDAADANDQPITSTNGQTLELIVDNNRLSTKAVVCSPSNIRIWPGKGAGPGLGGVAPVDANADAGLVPDAKGVLKVTVYTGTDAGALELTARVADPSSAEPGVSKTLDLKSTADNFSLEQVITAGRAQDQAGFPGHDGPNTSNSSELDWLQSAKEAHLLPGWDYYPVTKTDGSASGIVFYKNGTPPGSGGVLNSDSHGFQPLLDGTPLPSLGAWAGATGYHPFLRSSGYNGDRFFYFGWVYEQGPADQCIRRGPD